MASVPPEIERPATYYAATALPQRPRPPLNGLIQTEVCVIGAGFTGISAALHLAERGRQVVVLEGKSIGWGASGRNGGQLVNSYSRDLDLIEKRYGHASAQVLGQLAFRGGEIIRQRVEHYRIPCALGRGNIFAACNRRQREELRARQRLWARYGHHQLEWVERSEIHRYLNTDRYQALLIDHRGGQVHPLNLLLGQAQALEQLAGMIFEQSQVVRLESGRPIRVHTNAGCVQAEHVILAGNAYLGGLVPALDRLSMPCGSQIVVTEALGAARANALIPSRMAVEDGNYKLDYYRLTEDHRLLFGGGVSYGGGHPADIQRQLRPRLLRLFPQLADVALEYAWSGDFLLTWSRLPMMGYLQPNVLYAQGYSGHGVCSSHLAGEMIADALYGRPQAFNAFAHLPHRPFPGGRWLRVPYTALGAAYYGLRDWLGL